MPIEYAPRIVERHFGVSDEQQLLASGVLDHNLRVACIAKALLDRPLAPSAPVAVPAPEAAPAPEVAPPVVAITQRARPDSLRERFGIG
ncbi:hypothetical protein [Sphingobium sp. Leaf26]|uniref:hypothetical protein n=1 Tax=Sphingobium sp. Leaf26 TaxID=1735693 RepID=UPI0012E10E27|nr:hypothetical protein [Sphingobium sp. Leaf26]